MTIIVITNKLLDINIMIYYDSSITIIISRLSEIDDIACCARFLLGAQAMIARVSPTDFRTVLDLPKPKYCGAPNLCEDLY